MSPKAFRPKQLRNLEFRSVEEDVSKNETCKCVVFLFTMIIYAPCGHYSSAWTFVTPLN